MGEERNRERSQKGFWVYSSSCECHVMMPIHAELSEKAKAVWLSVSFPNVSWPPSPCHLCATDNYPPTQLIRVCSEVWRLSFLLSQWLWSKFTNLPSSHLTGSLLPGERVNVTLLLVWELVLGEKACGNACLTDKHPQLYWHPGTLFPPQISCFSPALMEGGHILALFSGDSKRLGVQRQKLSTGDA